MGEIKYGKLPIRSITKGGLVRDGMCYTVGYKYIGKKHPIVDIQYDEEYFYKTDEPRYHIYIDLGDGAPELYLWKTVTGKDITVEYDIEYQRIDNL